MLYKSVWDIEVFTKGSYKRTYSTWSVINEPVTPGSWSHGTRSPVGCVIATKFLAGKYMRISAQGKKKKKKGPFPVDYSRSKADPVGEDW